jgi:hypothetical protein
MADVAATIRSMPTAPPPVLGSARVLAYAVVDDAMPFTGRCAHYVDGVLLGRVPRLAIVEELADTAEIMLLHCDEEWNVLRLSGSGTVAEVKARTEVNYPGIGARWVDVGTTREEALAYYDSLPGPSACAFCGKRAFESKPQ